MNKKLKDFLDEIDFKEDKEYEIRMHSNFNHLCWFLPKDKKELYEKFEEYYFRLAKDSCCQYLETNDLRIEVYEVVKIPKQSIDGWDAYINPIQGIEADFKIVRANKVIEKIIPYTEEELKEYTGNLPNPMYPPEDERMLVASF